MTRGALLIGNPGEKNTDNYCEGVKIDIDNYKKYLMSPRGGSWDSGEIKILTRPSSLDLLLSMISLKKVDYSFIVFCGHGYETNGKIMLEMTTGHSIEANELKKDAKKRTIILDSCRVEYIPQILHESVFAANERFAAQRTNARMFFDEALRGCVDSVITINSCSFNETANENSQFGGYYSSSLLDWSIKADFNNDDYFTIAEAHIKAAEIVKSMSQNKQNPTIDKPRLPPGVPTFPFVIDGI